MENNNLFQYATKELSQDAMLCWLVNWLNYPESKELYQLGKDVLDLFLGDDKQEKYFNVQVKRQYKKIDVLILFNDQYALIIEDKTNTSEHGDQIARYKELLQTDFPDRIVKTAYIKTGIMYDEDYMMINKTDVIITLQDFYRLLEKYTNKISSDILSDYTESLAEMLKKRNDIDNEIESGTFCDIYDEKLEEYKNIFADLYGQFSFLNKVFSNRGAAKELGDQYNDNRKEKNPKMYYNYIYPVNNNGNPCTQYCFWGKCYKNQLLNTDEIEYCYLFWRLDSYSDRKEKKTKYYIALRYYDKKTKENSETMARKEEGYKELRKECDVIFNNNNNIFKKLSNGKEKNCESDLLYIPLDNLIQAFGNDFYKIKEFLCTITLKIKDYAQKHLEDI